MFSSIAIYTNNSFQHYSFLFTDLNGCKYCDVTPITKCFQVFLSKRNNSNLYQSFVGTHFNGFKYCYRNKYFYLLIVKSFQVSLCNTNNFTSVICFHTVNW